MSRIGGMMRWKTQAAFLAVAIIFLFPACDQLPQLPTGPGKSKDLADQAAAAGDYPKAVRLYEQALDGTNKTAEIHYLLAIVYDSRLNDPVSALHHYRRYLRMEAEQRRAEEVSRSIARIERDLATRLGGGLVTKSEAVRLRNENTELRKQLAQARGVKAPPPAAASASKPPVDARGFSTVPATKAAEAAVGSETRTYTVQRGDTLAAISRRFFKTPQRWKDIADANHNQLQGTTNIREGMVLIIP